MQGHVVENRPNIVSLELFEHLLLVNFWCLHDVIHVRIVLPLIRNDWTAQDSGFASHPACTAYRRRG